MGNGISVAVGKNLLKRIELYLDRHAMEATAFGIAAVNDGHLVRDLEKGERRLRRITVRDVEYFLKHHEMHPDRKKRMRNGR